MTGRAAHRSRRRAASRDRTAAPRARPRRQAAPPVPAATPRSAGASNSWRTRPWAKSRSSSEPRPASVMRPSSRPRAPADKTRRVFPIPGGPSSRSSEPFPATASRRHRSTRARAGSRSRSTCAPSPTATTADPTPPKVLGPSRKTQVAPTSRIRSRRANLASERTEVRNHEHIHTTRPLYGSDADAADSVVPVLWQLQISHYVEKVRWALDYKRVPHVRRTLLPGLHVLKAKRLTGDTSTTPVLTLDGRSIGDSTRIIAALEERWPRPPLYPEDQALRRRALELEEFFDEELGPHPPGVLSRAASPSRAGGAAVHPRSAARGAGRAASRIPGAAWGHATAV